MRETKEQKITRLEKKVDELKDQIKQIKKENRKYKHLNLKGGREYQNEIDGYQNEIIELQSNINALTQQNADTEEKLKNKTSEAKWYLQGWKRQLILFVKEKDFDGKTTSLMPSEWIIEHSNLTFDDYIRWAHYWLGFCCDWDGYTFFSLNDLIIKFNPLNGTELNDRQHNKILEKIKGDESYKEALEYIKPHTYDAYKGYPDGLRIINEKGKEVLKLYEDYLIQQNDLYCYSL